MRRLLCCALAGAALGAAAAPQAVRLADAAWPVDNFTLDSVRGPPFTATQLQQRWTFVVFAGAACADPCRGALAAIAGVQQRIARADVARHTQALLVAPQPVAAAPGVIAGAGAPAVVQRLAEDWRVADGPPAEAGTIYLVGPDGSVRAQYLPPFDVPLLTAHFLKTRARGG